MGKIQRAADPRFFEANAHDIEAGARRGHDGMRRITRGVPVLRGHQQLSDAGKQNETRARGTCPASRGFPRKIPMPGRLGMGRLHLLHLWNENNDYSFKNASVTFLESSKNR
jgi:hypothetical protein